MGRIFSIHYLEPEQHAKVDACLRRHRFANLDAMLAELQADGISISRSALHRYARDLKARDVEQVGTADNTVVVIMERASGTVRTITTAASGAAIAALIEKI